MAVHTWAVDELCSAVAEAIQVVFPDELWIRGEIKGLRKSPAGHLYFDLIEPNATGRGADMRISVVAFRGPLRGIEAVLKKVGNLKLEDGIEVRIRGRLDYYPPQGRVQFLMNAIDPRYTLGQLAADRDRVLQVLAAEGLLERNRSLEMPSVPLRIGLVTSDDSAAYNDVVEELRRSPYAFRIHLVDARVQGLDAEESLVRAITHVSTLSLDVILVVRGGGAKTDLVAFDRESVARAIAMCSVPVLVGIGHEIDRSVVDEVAHASLKTPTACAAAVVDTVHAFMQRLGAAAHTLASRSARSIVAGQHSLAERTNLLARTTLGSLRLGEQVLAAGDARMQRASTRSLAQAADRLDRQVARLATTSNRHVERAETALRSMPPRLATEATRLTEREDRRLASASSLVAAVHPDRTLARGFSITRDADGRAVQAPPLPGAVVTTETIGGAFNSTVVDPKPETERL
ncbi:MAG: exodeoxyribonuclease VII large subunit [Candidatus Poriferisodalaceae bacterium]